MSTDKRAYVTLDLSAIRRRAEAVAAHRSSGRPLNELFLSIGALAEEDVPALLDHVDALTRVVDAASEFVSEQDSWLNAPMEAEPPAPSVESFNRLRDELSALTKKDSTS